MELAPGWTTIVACPVGGRDVVLFYDQLTGNALTVYIDLAGVGIPLRTFTLSPGWSNIVFCNRYLLFFNDSTGVAAIGNIRRDGWFEQSAAVAPLGPGRAIIVSDAHHLLIGRGDTELVCRLVDDKLGRNPKIKILGQHRLSLYASFWNAIWVAGREMIVAYSVSYREEASYLFMWIDAAAETQVLQPWTETDPNWTTIVLSNGYILFYDEGIGGGKIVTGSPDYILDYEPWRPANIQANWSHIIPVGTRLLFYAQYNGLVRLGHISPDGEFSGEIKL